VRIFLKKTDQVSLMLSMMALMMLLVQPATELIEATVLLVKAFSDNYRTRSERKKLKNLNCFSQPLVRVS